MTSARACDVCIARSWLVARLAGHIENLARRSPARRPAELLALPDDALLQAAAPRHRAEIEAEMRGLDLSQMRDEISAAESWAVCRHSTEFPLGLLELNDPPAVLFGRGDRSRLVQISPERAVTVVGSRRATVYGLGVAKELARELALSGMAVVSGLAIGIDGAAQTGALEAGLSCAVLGCGIDRAYPARHRRLYDRHVAGGLIVSELPLGTAPWRWTFPARNRVMAALTGMTVVVEATERSGSLITATIAQEMGRDLGAVPGAVTSRASGGPNELLSNGACVVRNAQDVLDALLGVGVVSSVPVGPRLESDLQLALTTFEEFDGDPDAMTDRMLAQGIGPEAALARLEAFGYIRCSLLGTWSRTSLAVPIDDVR